MENSFCFFTEGVLLFIFGICGIFGNTAAIVVLGRKVHHKTNFYALMLCLAVFDLCYICLALIIFSFARFSKTYEDGLWCYITPFAIPMIQISLTGSIYCTMAITLERYLAVCKPFYRITREWSSRMFIVPIILVSIIYNIPQFFEIQTCEQYDTYTPNDVFAEVNSTVYCHGNIFHDSSIVSKIGKIALRENETMEHHSLYINFTNLRLDKRYQVYKTCSNFLVNAGVPFIFIFVLNARILKDLKNRYLPPGDEHETVTHVAGNQNGRSESTLQSQEFRLRDNSNGRNDREVNKAKISLSIAIGFIICHSVKWITNILEIKMLFHGMMSGYKIEDSNNYTNSITSSNDSVVLSTSSPISEAIQGNNSKDTFEDNESNKWPDWAKSVQCISHVLLTFYSSVTFLIYYVKQKNIGRRGFFTARRATVEYELGTIRNCETVVTDTPHAKLSM